MEPQIRFCTSADGTRIAYASVGEGPPLVCIPIWGANMEVDLGKPRGHSFIGRLSRGRRLVAFDRRGVGNSQREVEELSLDAHLADVDALANHLGLERFDVWAAQDGASVAVAYAARNPERVSRITLFAPYPRGQDIFRAGAVRGLVELVREHWSMARRAIADVIFPSGPIELQRELSDMLRQSVAPETAARYLEFMSGLDVSEYMAHVRAPTLIVHRRGDRNIAISGGRAAAALIPDARFVALEGDIAHPFYGDTSYVDVVTAFLDEGRAQTTGEAPAPAAVQTILFTDVEGSTAMTQRLGDERAREALREHERIVREALKAHGGSEVKTMGDGFMASFGSATKALECAIAIQRAFAERNESVRPELVEGPDAPAEPAPSAHPSRASGRAGGDAGVSPRPIRVRIGLNAGEPIAEDDPDGRGDLFGTAVILAARIAAQAQGGEILASNVVRELVAGKGFLFADRGEGALRGFEDPVRLYEVRWRE